MTISQNTRPHRGSFPKGPRGEMREARRERHELWVISTRAPQPDYEGQAIAFYRGKTRQVRVSPTSSEYKTVPKPPSRRLCINSACWLCEAGHDDSGAQERIAACARQRCALHPARPYRADASAPGALKQVIKSYCLECTGGSRHEAKLCHAVTCPVWPVRPGHDAEEAADETPEAEE